MNSDISKETEQAFKIINTLSATNTLYNYLVKNKDQIDFEEIKNSTNILNDFCYHISDYSKKEALDILDFLIENTIYLNQMDYDGITPIINILRRAPKEVIEEALDKLMGAGGDLNKYEKDTALMWAASQIKDEELFKKILSEVSDEVFYAISVNEDYKESSIQNANAAHYAANEGNIKNLRLLIEENIDMSRENSIYQTPLQVLCAKGWREEAVALIKEYPELLEIEYDNLNNNKRTQNVDNYFYLPEDKMIQDDWLSYIRVLKEQQTLEKAISHIDLENKPQKLATQKI